MKILEITKSITIVNPLPHTYVKGSLYLFSEYQTNEFNIMCMNLNINSSDFSKFYEVDWILKPFQPKNKRVFIHRTGGVGDIIALSSVCNYLYDNGYNISFITQVKKYAEVFDWYEVPVTLIDHTNVLPFKNDVKHNLRINNIGLLQYERKIEQAKDNWMELFFKPINSNIDFSEYGRPQLINDIPHQLKQTENGILFTLRASANIRSIDFKPIYLALEPIIKNVDIPLYIHEVNINKRDFDFIKHIQDKRIKILPKTGLKQFLFDVCDAKLVISTDTGALHFREAIGKKSLGIYNAFTSECRCKYYKYTQTIDIKSNCIHQPCFTHVSQPDAPCLNKEYCMDMQYNKTLVYQLHKFFEEYMI